MPKKSFLRDLLVKIGRQLSEEKMTFKTILEEVVNSGYKSHNNTDLVVYQQLRILVREGVYTRDSKTMQYQFVGNLGDKEVSYGT